MDPHVIFDCEKALPNRFVLVLAAAARTRALNRGAEPRLALGDRNAGISHCRRSQQEHSRRKNWRRSCSPSGRSASSAGPIHDIRALRRRPFEGCRRTGRLADRGGPLMMQPTDEEK